MCHIRIAEKNDVDVLNKIAYESEAYWGYDLEYMKRFEEIYRVTEDYIRVNPTFILLMEIQFSGFTLFQCMIWKRNSSYFISALSILEKATAKKCGTI